MVAHTPSGRAPEVAFTILFCELCQFQRGVVGCTHAECEGPRGGTHDLFLRCVEAHQRALCFTHAEQEGIRGSSHYVSYRFSDNSKGAVGCTHAAREGPRGGTHQFSVRFVHVTRESYWLHTCRVGTRLVVMDVAVGGALQ